MEKITHINLGDNSYDIIISKGILNSVGTMVKTVYNSGKIALITDETVDKLYGKQVVKSLVSAGFDVNIFALKSGEETKSIENVSYLLSSFAKMGLSRKDIVIGLGGGVIGDLSGFVASCYMRGIPHIQIPTTLLSQVDSSVGGKTAVNLPEGKNLVGAFWQPKLVIIDTVVLETLDNRQFSTGMAEVIKYGAIFSKEFFKFLKSHKGRTEVMKVMPEVILKCCDFKKEVVQRDEKDTGERMLLNFGHTFGHIIETLGTYTKYTHGEGVAIGMCVAARFGHLIGITTENVYTEIKELCEDFDLPVNDKITPSLMISHIGIDKKAGGGKVSLILLTEIGESVIHPLSFEDFALYMQEGEKLWK